MSHEVLQALTDTLNGSTYDDHAEKLPNMGVRHKVSDLRIKAKKVEQDGTHFEKVGLTADEFAQQLLDSADALESSHLLFTTMGDLQSAASKVMHEYGDTLESLRNEVMGRLRFIANMDGHPELKPALFKISQGDDKADTIMDLGSCYELAQRKADALAKRNYSAAQIAELGEIYSKVSKAYPQVQVREKESLDALQLRNRAFWHAVKVEKDLRDYVLPMVFWENGDWRARYRAESRR